MYSFGVSVPPSKYGSYGFQKRAENPAQSIYSKRIEAKKKKKDYTPLVTAGLIIASAVLAYKGKDQISTVLTHAKKFLSEKGAKAANKFPNIASGLKSFKTAFANGKNAILHPLKK